MAAATSTTSANTARSLFEGDDNDFLASAAPPPVDSSKQLFSGSDDFLHTSALNGTNSHNSSFGLLNKDSFNSSSVEQIGKFSSLPTNPALGTNTSNNLMSSFGSTHMNATSSPTKTNDLNNSFPVISNNNSAHSHSMPYSPVTSTPSGLSYSNTTPYMTQKLQELNPTNNTHTPTFPNHNNLPTFKPASFQPPMLSSPYSTPNNQNHLGSQNQQMPSPSNPTFNMPLNTPIVAQGSHMPAQNQNPSAGFSNNSAPQSGLFIPTMYASQNSKTTTTTNSFFVPTQPTTTTTAPANTMEPYNPTNFSQINNYNKQQDYNQGYNTEIPESYQMNSQSTNGQHSNNVQGGGMSYY